MVAGHGGAIPKGQALSARCKAAGHSPSYLPLLYLLHIVGWSVRVSAAVSCALPRGLGVQRLTLPGLDLAPSPATAPGSLRFYVWGTQELEDGACGDLRRFLIL